MIESFVRSALGSLGMTPEDARIKIDAALAEAREAKERLVSIEAKLDAVLAEKEKGDVTGNRKSA